jgi:formylmethanofuran--tetrahydromethanopterin N-formyltransferase
MEIVMNGRDLDTLSIATQAAIAAARPTPGLVRITAGNYGGRLGKSFIYLKPPAKSQVPAPHVTARNASEGPVHRR